MKHNRIFIFALIILMLAVSSPVQAKDSGEKYVIGNLNWWNPVPFEEEMASLGYVAGDNVTYMNIPSGDEAPDQSDTVAYQAFYEQQIQLIVEAGADVFVVNTDTDAVNLKPLVGDIPIVFGRSDDPVATGAVESLVRPGGTMTGTITARPHERRLQLLTEILPSTDMVYFLYSPLALEAQVVLEQTQAVGDSLGVEVIAAQTPDGPTGIETLENMPEEVDWLFLTPHIPFFDTAFTQKLLATATERQIGAAWITDDPAQGYVVSYGPNIAASDRQCARIVDRILRGASPADLPVETAENFLTINLEAAEAIGLEVPAGVLRQANNIIYPGYEWPQMGETTE